MWRFASVATVVGGLCAASAPAFATQDVDSFVNVAGRVCFDIRDSAGNPTDGPLWTINWMGGVRQLGRFYGSGCVDISGMDRKLRAGIRDSDVIKITRSDLRAAGGVGFPMHTNPSRY